jgi:hypothetical protein
MLGDPFATPTLMFKVQEIDPDGNLLWIIDANNDVMSGLTDIAPRS